MAKSKPRLLIQGMHGMGDSLHQRAVVRQLSKDNEVWLETSWPSVYYDLDVKLLKKNVALRTQTKNSARPSENEKFSPSPGSFERSIRPRYVGQQVLSCASKTVLEAMCLSVGADYETADYRMPIPEVWGEVWRKSSACAQWRESGKPLMVYRPLVMRTEWRGSGARNADPECYAKLLASVRDAFFVISVADLEPQREWIVGPKFEADVQFHEGQLNFETLAYLFADADVIYTSGGFAAILGPAVGTPVINVIGGYEHSGSQKSGERFAPMIDFGPTPGCSCWSSACRQPCDKTFDVDAALPKLVDFIDRHITTIKEPLRRAWQDMHGLADGGYIPPPATPFRAPPLDLDPGLPISNSRHPHHALWLSMTRSSARKNAGPRA